MKESFAKFLENVTINQIFLWLILTYFGIWFSESQEMDCLCKASWILFILTGISVIICMIFYTIEYCTRKWKKTKSHK